MPIIIALASAQPPRSPLILLFTRLPITNVSLEKLLNLKWRELKFSTNEPMSETSHLRPWKALTLLGKGPGTT